MLSLFDDSKVDRGQGGEGLLHIFSDLAAQLKEDTPELRNVGKVLGRRPPWIKVIVSFGHQGGRDLPLLQFYPVTKLEVEGLRD